MSILNMDMTFTLVIITIALALIFDFLNGFHDAANSIATIVSTRVLKPHYAVLWAASFNFIAFLFFGVKVATMIGVGLINPTIINVPMVFSALIGAIFWNIFTWYFGIPSSSSHALIGGLLGAGIAKAGFAPLNLIGILKVLLAIIISPMLGALMASLLIFVIARLCFYSTPSSIDHWFRKLQLISSACISLGHGGNDAQKTMGIIAILLYSAGLTGNHFYVPVWVVISCYLVISLGTLFGGWRIVKTMGMRITKLKPFSGFCAETASALTLVIATVLGIPVSTTHTIAGAIVGVGSLNGAAAVRWGIARNIVWAWVLTIPAAGVVGALAWWVLKFSASL